MWAMAEVYVREIKCAWACVFLMCNQFYHMCICIYMCVCVLWMMHSFGRRQVYVQLYRNIYRNINMCDTFSSYFDTHTHVPHINAFTLTNSSLGYRWSVSGCWLQLSLFKVKKIILFFLHRRACNRSAQATHFDDVILSKLNISFSGQPD